MDSEICNEIQTWSGPGSFIGDECQQGDALNDLNTELLLLESQAINFATRWIRDTRVRREYIAAIKELSPEYLRRISLQEIPPKQAAEEVHAMRNIIMDAMRGKSSDIGRAMAESMKKEGVTLEQLLSKYGMKACLIIRFPMGRRSTL